MTRDQHISYRFFLPVVILICLALQLLSDFPRWLCWAPLWVPLATDWWVLATRCIAEGFSGKEKEEDS